MVSRKEERQASEAELYTTSLFAERQSDPAPVAPVSPTKLAVPETDSVLQGEVVLSPKFPSECMVTLAVVLVAKVEAEEVAKYRLPFTERKFQGFWVNEPSVNVSCEVEDVAMVRRAVGEGEVVPMPRFPEALSLIPSVRSPVVPFTKNARSAAGVEVETLVKMEAIRAVEVAVVVALSQLASAHHVEPENRSPVPIPLAMVPVALWCKFKTSVSAFRLVSERKTESAVVVASDVEALVRETLSPAPKKPVPPTLRPEDTKRFWLNCAKFSTWSVPIIAEPMWVLAMYAPPMSTI